MGQGIGNAIGALITPKAAARSAASNAQEYKCRHCGYTTSKRNVKRDMVAHLG